MQKANNCWEAQLAQSNIENYNKWIYNKIAEFFGNRCLDIGSSVDNITKYMIDRQFVVSIDIEEGHVNHQKKIFSEHKNIVIERADICDKSSLSLQNYKIDTAICLNVLEHIKDENAALKNIYDILPPGGKLIILVPAFPCLFGSLDLDHQRRYTVKYLKEVLMNNNFKIMKIFYMNFIGMIFGFVNGKILKKEVSEVVHSLKGYNFLFKIISIIDNIIGPPFGLSIVAVCEK